MLRPQQQQYVEEGRFNKQASETANCSPENSLRLRRVQLAMLIGNKKDRQQGAFGV